MNYDLFLFNGHGEGDNGACFNGYKEQDLAKKLVQRIKQLLIPYNVNVHTNGDLNNYQRNLTKGNSYKYVEGLSIHLNATSTHNARGSEIIIPCRLSNFGMQRDILKELEKIGFSNRGVKSRDYISERFMTRTMDISINCKDYYKEIREAYNNGYYLSILEVCFIDSEDLNLFNSKFESIANAIANVIVRKYGLKKTVNDETYYRVVTGSFTDKENANKRLKELEKKGYKSFIEVKER